MDAGALNAIIAARSNISSNSIECGAIYPFMDVRLSCITTRERLCVPPMAGFKKRSLGPMIIRE